MSKSRRVMVPLDIFKNAETIVKNSGLPHKQDGFAVINNLAPEIIGIQKIRKPRSKDVFLQIDTRQLLRLK